MVRGAVRLDRRVVGVTFHDLVNARFVGAEQAVIAVAGFVRVHGGGQLGEDVLELCFLAGLHAQRRDDADGAHIYLSLLSFRCESRGRPSTPARPGYRSCSISSRPGYIGDRKSVVSGKSVSVRVDLGGRRTIKNKANQENQTKKH